MTFPCTKCGLCCKNIDKIPQLSHYHAGDGICFHYNDDVGCTIYANRPDVCRVDEGYQKFFSLLIKKQDYYIKNAQICNQIQIANNLDEKYRVVL